MNELFRERVLVVLALLLCVAAALLAVWETPELSPQGIVYTDTTSESAASTAVYGASSGLETQGELSVSLPEPESTDESATAPSATLPPTAPPTSAPASEPLPAGVVNLTTASAEELMTLPGIGETLARRIVEYRETHGGFHSIEEVQNVSGIGEKRFAAIRESITV